MGEFEADFEFQIELVMVQRREGQQSSITAENKNNIQQIKFILFHGKAEWKNNLQIIYLIVSHR
jgi:hypothetical protein